MHYGWDALRTGGSREGFGRLSNYQIQGKYVVNLGEEPATSLTLDVSPSITRGRARVSFALPKAGNVKVRLFDVTGRRCVVLVDGWREPGRYKADVDARTLAQGIYVLKCETADNRETRKLVVQR